MGAGSLLGVSSLLVGVTASSYFGYELLRPKNLAQYLVWKGYRLIKEDSVWDAVFEEYGSEFKNSKELKSYCSRELNKLDFNNLSKAIEYCVDEIRTVKGELIREGSFNKLIKKNEEYELALVLRSSNKEFLELINNNIEGYREWCESNLNKKPSKALVTNVKTFCIPKPYKTASGKLDDEGFKKLTKEELGAKYDELFISSLSNIQTNTLLVDIAENNNVLELKQSKESFKEAYWKWCEKEGERSLVEKNYYPQGYFKFKSRCADIEALKVVWQKSEEIRKTNPFVQEVLEFEKANSCDIYFAQLRVANRYFKVDDPIWVNHKNTLEEERLYGNRNIYEGFAKLVRDPKTKEICKDLNGKRYLVAWQWKEKVWA